VAEQGYLDTLKEVALLAVPPAVVTLMAPVFAPVGTLVVILVAASFVIVAAAPLKLTFVAPERLVPVTVILSPTLPEVGLKDVIVGAAGFLVAYAELATADIPKSVPHMTTTPTMAVRRLRNMSFPQ